MGKFILNRPDDHKFYSRKEIIWITVKWFFLLWFCAIALRVLCVAVYMGMGVNPMEQTKFLGDPTTHMDHVNGWMLLHFMLVAPLAEELMFRLGLSFRRYGVALWAGLLPLICTYYLFGCRNWLVLLVLILLVGVIFWLVCRYTTNEQWAHWRTQFIVPAMWVSAIAFGLIHFKAFSVLNAQVFPFALATVLVPMAGGCAITYARVNLGFWYGVALHCIMNIPAVLMLASALPH